MPKRKHVARKGIELPINTLVVVAVAVIILLGVVAFFMGGFSGVSSSMQKRQTFLNECQSYVQLGCQGEPSSTIQNKYYDWIENAPTKTAGTNKAELDKIKQSCGCFGSTATGGSGGSGGGGSGGGGAGTTRCASGEKCCIPTGTGGFALPYCTSEASCKNGETQGALTDCR